MFCKTVWLKRKNVVVVLLLLSLLATLLLACGETGKETEEQVDYAKKPLVADSDINRAQGSGKPDAWRGFRCKSTVFSPTSEFPLNDVTLSVTLEGDFSDEHADETVARWDNVTYCDLSKLSFLCESAHGEDSYLYVFDRQTLGEYARDDDYSETSGSFSITIPENAFLFNVGVIYLTPYGEVRTQGESAPMNGGTQLFYGKTNDVIRLSTDALAFQRTFPHETPVGDGFFRGKNAVDALTRSDYCAFLFDEEKEAQYIINFIKTFGEDFGMDTTGVTYAMKNNAEYPSSSDMPYVTKEDVNVTYYFGGLDGEREKYEYVELYFMDETRPEKGKFFVKRIDNYGDEEYSCKKLVSLRGDAAYLQYAHSETLTVPQAVFSVGRGRVCMLVLGKERDKDTMTYLCGVAFDYQIYSEDGIVYRLGMNEFFHIDACEQRYTAHLVGLDEETILNAERKE